MESEELCPGLGRARVGWLGARAGEVPTGDDWLSEREREVATGLRIPPRQASWRLGRWAAKRLWRAWAGDGSAEVEILAAADGAPELWVDGRLEPLSLSLTHRVGWAVAMLSPLPALVGCDLEAVEPRSDAFVRDYLTAREQQRVMGLGRAARREAVALAWSAKESVLKLLRTGLRRDPRGLELVQWGRDGLWSPLVVSDLERGDRYHGFWRRQDTMVLTMAGRPAPDVPLRLDGAT